MDYIKSFFNYFRSTDTIREKDNNDLSNRYSISPNNSGSEHIGGIISRDAFDRDQEITDSIFNKFFSGNRSDEDNDIPGFFPDRGHHPFFGSGMTNVSNVDSYFENLMNDVERHVRSMMRFQGFSDFNIEDFQGDYLRDMSSVLNGQEFRNDKQLTGDSLRDHYLNTGETDINPGVNQQIVTIEPGNVEPVRFNYRRMEKVVYKVNPDGTAEVTQIVKDGEGREERNVTKFKLF